MEYSCFSSYGSLAYDADLPDAEKIYESLRASYTDKTTGVPAVDMTVGTYHEAKLYARAMALADANAATRRAGNQGNPLKATESLPHFEHELRLAPKPTDTLEARRAAVAARKVRSRGNRYEALHDGLATILGSALLAVRPIAAGEATTWPVEPASGPGVFVRNEQPAKLVRLLDPVPAPVSIADSYGEENQSINYIALSDIAHYQAASQSFTGNGETLLSATFYLKKAGSPTGNAVAKIYAHAGTFGTSSVPTGTALATSGTLDASTLTTSYALIEFAFSGANQIRLVAGARYVLAIEYTAGSVGNTVIVGTDDSTPTHAGNHASNYGGWAADSSLDTCFYVHTRAEPSVSYENWDTARAAIQLAKGDVLSVQPENIALAEKVTVLSASGTGATRSFTAAFTKAHDEGAAATSGPAPIWWSDLGHILVVVTHAAAISAELVARVDEYLTRALKGGGTWSIVEPTSPGATTVGPFTLDSSPLGAVSIGELPVVPLEPPVLGFCSPASGGIAGSTLVTLYGRRLGDATDVKVDGVSATFTKVSDYRLTFTTAAHGVGAQSVTVVTPFGTTTKAALFTFV